MMKPEWKRLGTTLAIILTLTYAKAELIIEIPDGPAVDVKPTDDTTPNKRSDAKGDSKQGPINDILSLRNSDRLQGELLSIEGVDGIVWRHPAVSKPLQLEASSIHRIKLSPRPNKDQLNQTAEIVLTNGDRLPGTMISVDKDALVLDTWYAKRLTIERAMISEIRPGLSTSKEIFTGPVGLEGWTQSNSSASRKWRFKNGVFESANSVSIGRMVDIPKKSSIEFDLAWTAHPSFMVCFYTDNITRYYGNCYAITCSGSSLYLQRYTKNGSSSNLGNVSISKVAQKRNAHFQILTDSTKATVTLMVNGELLHSWTDPKGFGGLGKGLLFYPQSQNPMKVRNIAVSDWDGTTPNAPDDGETQKNDVIRLSNGDKVTGTLVGIKDGATAFKTEFATLTVPIDRIQKLTLGTVDQGRARRRDQDVALTFPNGGKMTLALDSFKDGMLVGKSENFGSISARIEAFNLLTFNIYDDVEEGDDDDWD